MAAKPVEFIKKNSSFVLAAGLLAGVLVMVYIASCFNIHPVTAEVPDYRRMWILFLVFVAISFVGAVLLGWHLFVRKLTKNSSFVRLAAIIVSFFAVTYMFVLPPMSAPDEIRHYLAAYDMSNKMMFKTADDGERHVYMRAEDAEILLNDFPGNDDYFRMVCKSSWFGKADDTPVLFTAERAQRGFFLSFLPQALGITFARILGLKQLPLMFMARFFNLMFYMVFFILALRILPFGKEVLFIVTMLPMTLEQISSMSYDACLFALSYYFIAYVLNMAFTASKVTKKDMIILTAVLALLAPVKVVYLMLAPLMFIIPREKFGKMKNYLLSAGFMLVVVGAVFLIDRIGMLSEFVEETDLYLSFADAYNYSLSFLLSHPKITITIFLNTFHVFGGLWYTDMIGNRLGWQDVQVPMVIVMLFGVLMGVAALKPANEPAYWKPYQRFWNIFTFTLVGLMAIAAMLLACTPEGWTSIQGVQGRYFTPALPLALFAVRGDSLRRNEKTDRWIVFLAVLLNIWSIACVIGGIMVRTGVTKMLPAS